MADINTGSLPGEQQRVFAEAPQFPTNLGKIDVAAIYDAASKGMAQPEALANAARQGTAGNSALKTMLQQEVAKRSLIPAQTGQAAAEAAAATGKAGFLAKGYATNPTATYAAERVGIIPSSTDTHAYLGPDGNWVNETTTSLGGQQVASAKQSSPYSFMVDELGKPAGGIAGLYKNTYLWTDRTKPRTVTLADGSIVANPDSTTLVNRETTPVIPREQPDALKQAVEAYGAAVDKFGEGTPEVDAAKAAYGRVAAQLGVPKPETNPESEKLIDDAAKTQDALNAAVANHDAATAATLGSRLQDIRNRQAKINEPSNKANPADAELTVIDKAMLSHWTNIADRNYAVAATADRGSPERDAALKAAADASAKAEAIAARYQSKAAAQTTPSAAPAATTPAAPGVVNKGTVPPGTKTVNIGGNNYPVFVSPSTGARFALKDGGYVPIGPEAQPSATAPAAPTPGTATQ
jgi:hypothetical protein